MSESGQEATWVTVKQAPGEFIRYRHLDFVFPFGGTCDPNTAVCTVPENQAPVQPAGTQVGSVGDAAKHLHAGARNRLDVEGVTFPIAFTDYWVWEPQQFPVPTHVTRGVPKTGQYILRTH
jgi:hypothetical protein